MTTTKKIISKEINFVKKNNNPQFIIIDNLKDDFDNLYSKKYFDSFNYNFVLDDNNIYKLVDPKFQSNIIKTNTEINSANSIVICTLVNNIYTNNHRKCLVSLIKYLMNKYKIDKRCVITIDDIINNNEPFYLCNQYRKNLDDLYSSIGLNLNFNVRDAFPEGEEPEQNPNPPSTNTTDSGEKKSDNSVHSIDDLLGEIGEKYDTPSLVHTMQLDPNIRTVTNFKQEYTVIIRKKKYYAINALEDENSYIRMYQVDNFTSLSTDIDCNNAGSGSCSVTIVGNTRIICAERQKQDDTGWSDFDAMLNGWSYELDDNDTIMDANGRFLYNDIVYDNINNMKQAKYGWRIAEKCDFEPMDEIHVYGKSRTVRENGKFKVFKIFFGYITDVTKSYTAGKSSPTITIRASDHCKLLDISYIAQTMAQCHITAFAGAHYDKDFAGNIIIDDNAQPSSDSPAIGVNLFTNIFAGKFPYEIIQRCAIDAGIPEKYLTDRIEKIKRVSFMPQLSNNQNIDIFKSDLRSRLHFCKEAASVLLLEFFADEEGNLVLKIPNWTLGVNKLPANNCFIDQLITEEEKALIDNGGIKKTTTTKTVTENHVVTDTVENEIVHTVTTGDTLWDLAEKYLGSSSRWPEIYNLNSDKISNPHWIYPGQVLNIKSGKTVERTDTITKEVEETTEEVVTMSSITDKYIPIIENDEVISFTICDSDQTIANCFQITAEIPMLGSAGNSEPLMVTRVVQDWSSIIRFGFRFASTVNVPMLTEEVSAVMFGTMLVAKAASQRYHGSLTMIEDSAIRVGNPIRMFMYDEHPYKFIKGYEKEGPYQAVFYVDKISRTISADSVSTMTLTLSAGRVVGMDSIYDKMKALYGEYFEEREVKTTLNVNMSQMQNGTAGGSLPISAVGKAKEILEFAQTLLGKPYYWGKETPEEGFDCSGFVKYVYGHFGFNFSHSTYAMKNEAPSVSTSDLQPADVLFFHDYGHTGIYMGDGNFIHAHGGPNKQGLPNYKVKIQELSTYWTQPCGAVRPLSKM